MRCCVSRQLWSGEYCPSSDGTFHSAPAARMSAPKASRRDVEGLPAEDPSPSLAAKPRCRARGCRGAPRAPRCSGGHAAACCRVRGICWRRIGLGGAAGSSRCGRRRCQRGRRRTSRSAGARSLEICGWKALFTGGPAALVEGSVAGPKAIHAQTGADRVRRPLQDAGVLQTLRRHWHYAK
jgi:hypothetical protein